jgi:PKD repeat protein
MSRRLAAPLLLLLVLALGLTLGSVAVASPSGHRSHARSDRPGARQAAMAAVRHLYSPNGHAHIYPAPRQRAKIAAAVNAATSAGASGGSSGFRYRGGLVMSDGVQSVPIFWEPDTLQDGTTAGYVVPGYEDGMVQFLDDMDQSRWLHTLTQYYQEQNDVRTYIKDASGVLQMVIDHSPYPTGSDVCAISGHPTNCIDDRQVRDEISKVRAANGLPGGTHTMYEVFTERDEATCFGSVDTGTACSMLPNLVYCAYHDAFSDPVDGQSVVYSVEPYLEVGGCHDPTDTFVNSQDLDLGRSILGHEVSEAATDPLPSAGTTGWLDGFGQEVADLCNFDFGADALDRVPGVLVNQVWNGNPYIVQRLFDSSLPGCGNAGPADAGGVRNAVFTGSWTNLAVSNDPARGRLVSLHHNMSIFGGVARPDLAAQAPSPDGSILYALDHSSDLLLPIGRAGLGIAGQDPWSFAPISHQATSIAVTPDGASALITNGTEGTLTTVDLATGEPTTSPVLGSSLADLAIAPDGGSVWVADEGALRHFSLPGLSALGSVPLPGTPSGLALSPSGADAYVALPSMGVMIDVILASGSTRWTRTPVSSSRPAVSPDGQSILAVGHDADRLWVIRPNGSTAGAVALGSPDAVVATADGNALVLTGDHVQRHLVPVNLTSFATAAPLRAEADSAIGSPISSQAPVAALRAPATTLGKPSTFDASASHSDYGIASYQWSFGDGSTATTTTPTVSHTYTRLGTYAVKLTVVDTLGVSTTGTVWDGHEYLRRSGSVATTSATTAVVPATTPRLLVATSDGLVPVFETGPSWAGAPLGGANGTIADFAVSPNGATSYLVTSAPVSRLVGVNLSTGASSAPVTLPETPKAIALSPGGTKAYVAVAGGILPVDLPAGVVRAKIPVGDDTTDLTDIVVSPDGTTAWTTDFTANLVYPVSLAAGTVGAPVPIGAYQDGLAMTPDGSSLLVPAFYSGEIDPISTATQQAGNPIALGGWFPQQDAVTPNGGTLLVTASNSITNDGATSLFGINLANGNLSPAVSVPRTNSRCFDVFGLCIPARVTISSMPDGATAYAGVTADDAVFPVTVSGLTLGSPVAVPGQQGIARAVPAQSPTARMKVSLGKPGKQSTFNGSGSTSPNGTVVRWDWSFGDGQSLISTTPSVHHTYAKAGSYPVTLTVTDSSGVSTTTVFDGHQLSRNGTAAATTTLIVKVS